MKAHTMAGALLLAAVLLAAGWAMPAFAGAPEVSLDIFAPGTDAAAVSLLDLHAAEDGSACRGAVTLYGHGFEAAVRMEGGAVASAVLRAGLSSGPAGMFLADMDERQMIPCLLQHDGTAVSLLHKAVLENWDVERCRACAREELERWTRGGRGEFRLAFLPQRAFFGAVKVLTGDAGAPMDDVMRCSLGFDPNLVPHEERTAYGLALSRRDSSLALTVCAVQRAGAFWDAGKK